MTVDSPTSVVVLVGIDVGVVVSLFSYKRSISEDGRRISANVTNVSLLIFIFKIAHTQKACSYKQKNWIKNIRRKKLVLT